MAESPQPFEPKIIALCCNYCAYTAADLAGSTRLKYPANVTIVRLPCSGKADVIHILKAFGDGADGVYVAGCREGDCHQRQPAGQETRGLRQGAPGRVGHPSRPDRDV
jgi:coenzyme F420-reducing hydrogenase delta subunit